MVGRLREGAWYAKELASVQPIGVGRDRTLVVGLDASLARTVEITSLPDYVTGSLTIGSRVETRFAPYSPRVLIDHAGGCLWAMASDDMRLEIFGPDGRRARTAMVPAVPVHSVVVVVEPVPVEVEALLTRRTVPPLLTYRLAVSVGSSTSAS